MYIINKFGLFNGSLPVYILKKNLRYFSQYGDPPAKWIGVVGLEVHAQINANSKLFSGASAKYGGPTNSQVSLFDAAIPGTLPVLNRKCVESAVLTALALNCTLHEISWFDRKHYFYSDLPAGYQITQQRLPFATNGRLEFQVIIPQNKFKPYLKEAKIKQIQLEQDSGKSLHNVFKDKTLVDLNRAGDPLMELVFEPDLNNGEEAAALIKELILILEKLNTCSCKMQEGALRVDANVSVRHKDSKVLGIRSEVKNISSIRAVANAVEFEIKRHVDLLESGEQVRNETRAWDAINNCTVSTRDKEVEQDYRFMPEPNLPPLRLSLEEINGKLISVPSISKNLPELPAQIREKLCREYGLSTVTAIRILDSSLLFNLFTALIEENKERNPSKVSNILIIDILSVFNKNNINPVDWTINSSAIGELMDLLWSERINRIMFNKLLNDVVLGVITSPVEFIESNDLWQINDEAEIRSRCLEAINANPKLTKQCLSKSKISSVALQKLLNYVNDKLDGKTNLKLASQLLQECLKNKK